MGIQMQFAGVRLRTSLSNRERWSIRPCTHHCSFQLFAVVYSSVGNEKSNQFSRLVYNRSIPSKQNKGTITLRRNGLQNKTFTVNFGVSGGVLQRQWWVSIWRYSNRTLYTMRNCGEFGEDRRNEMHYLQVRYLIGNKYSLISEVNPSLA